jgi:two-component system LytT family sensor kinase
VQTLQGGPAVSEGEPASSLDGLLATPAALLVLVGLLLVTVAVAIFYFLRNRRNTFATPLEKATFGTLHTVALAAPWLREGLSPNSAKVALPYLRTLLDTCALAMTDNRGETLGWDGDADQHEPDVRVLAEQAIATGRQQIISHTSITCDHPDCEVRGIFVVPLLSEDTVIGTLGALTTSTAGPQLLRATAEVGRYVSSQLELAELDESRARLDRAEVRALRAQISPHFVYNALTTIASFIRTDPIRARELLLEFADFTRYSFRTAGEYTKLKDELENIERYIALEKARFGDRLDIKLQIAPEALNVVLPFLALQPLVENAVRHGLASRPSGGTITITAEDAGAECVISVEDNGVGMDPVRLTEDLDDAHLSGAHVGLGNVDDRMRSTFGADFGLVVDTNIGAGTKITLRVPKFRAGIQA